MNPKKSKPKNSSSSLSLKTHQTFVPRTQSRGSLNDLSDSSEQFGPESFDRELKTEGLIAEGLIAEELRAEELRAEELRAEGQKPATKFITAHGRRKEAVARIRLFEGYGQLIVNDQPIGQYFPGKIAEVKWQRPFSLTGTLGKFYATIKVEGSGKSGQLDAVVHGLSRAFAQANTQYRPILKKAGLLTRDPRVKERRKYGLAQKARKGKQSPKR